MNKNKNFLSGKFLIASPSMLDPVFYKSVIYLISHRSEGAMGIVINQPIVQTKLENIISLEEFKKNIFNENSLCSESEKIREIS